jgi:alkylation response protein AidB-like acyl-CoA dehydrogenase
MTDSIGARRSASWLIETTDAGDVFTPEKLSEEHRLIAQTTKDFLAQEVLPQIDQLEQKDWDLARKLVRQCGELGLLGSDVPAAYGGSEFDKAASLVVNQHMSGSASFAVMAGAQANLATTPILLFGTEEQKQRYLPRLIAGELIGAFALSESEAGSDAANPKTRAVRQPDGGFVLNGEKMWITNGGFADLFIVFAKVDGEQFSAFIVERAFAGVSSGKEERKMGLHATSTTPVVLQDVKVPAANLLGEVGKGRKVAFAVLNTGRFELGATCIGASAAAIGEAARYAGQRRQFGQPIAVLGAIKHKLAEMTVRTYAVESLLYRTTGLMDAFLRQPGRDAGDASAALAVLEEYGIEASIAKVAGSETLDYVLDENLQIHGGNGFVEEYPAEGHYRDARVNRIFEGTNEVNRLMIPGTLLRKAAIRKAARAELLLVPAALARNDEMARPPATPDTRGDGAMEDEARLIAGCKKVTLMVLGLAMEQYGVRIADEQEVMMGIADMAIDVFGAESALLRSLSASRAGIPTAARHVDAARICVNDAAARIGWTARQALAAMADGDSLRARLAALGQLVDATPINTVALRRRIADDTAACGGYIFQ